MSNEILSLFNNYDVFYTIKFILKSTLIVLGILILYFVVKYCYQTIPYFINKYKTKKNLRSNLYLGQNRKSNKDDKDGTKKIKLVLCFMFVIIFTSYSFSFLESSIENDAFKDNEKFSSELNKLFIKNNLSETVVDLKTVLNLNTDDIFIKTISIDKLIDSKGEDLLNLSNKSDLTESDYKNLMESLNKNKNKNVKISFEVDYLKENEYKSEDLELNLILSEENNEYPLFSMSDVSFILNDEDISVLEKEVPILKYKYLLNVLDEFEETSKYPQNNIILNEDLLLNLLKEDNLELNYH